MMSRISRHQMFMGIAAIVAQRATCFRLNVGAVVACPLERNIVSTGYNGQQPGKDHCRSPCQAGQCNTTHAERNAILRATRGVAGCVMYCTDSPCAECAELISRSGITELYYQREYRDESPLLAMMQRGIRVFRVLPNGALVNKSNNQVIGPTDA